MTQKERNDLAKIYEKAENEEREEDVIAMRQVSYSEAANSRPIVQSNNHSSARAKEINDNMNIQSNNVVTNDQSRQDGMISPQYEEDMNNR